jgi:hypothetical protein
VDNAIVGSAPLSTIAGARRAIVSTSALSRGAHVVTALYLASSGFASSASTPAIHVVN